MKNSLLNSIFYITISFLIYLTGCSEKTESETVITAIEPEQILKTHSLDPWYPRVIDTINGGYYSTFAYDWSKAPNQNKFIVTQARHVWALSNAYIFYPERTDYKEYAEHGFLFLKDKMWDKEYGGFFELVDSLGVVLPGEYRKEKRAYGNAFAIYALAAYYQVSEDSAALDLAIDAFNWLDNHAHDDEFGGYFQYMEQNGDIIARSALENGYDAPDKLFVGLKDYNSSIHIMEALTELYRVWPNELLRDRLTEMFYVVSETMCDDRGFLKLYFYPDWKLVSDQEFTEIGTDGSNFTNHITFGHDVETAFLLLETAEALEIETNEILPQAKQLVDHALKIGWDKENGGFYEQGNYIDGKPVIVDFGKNWWAQAEGLNSLLLMNSLFPDDTNSYKEKYELLLNYVNTNLIDHDHTGWYSGGIDVHPEIKTSPKAQIWKGNYHTSRSLINCIGYLDE